MKNAGRIRVLTNKQAIERFKRAEQPARKYFAKKNSKAHLKLMLEMVCDETPDNTLSPMASVAHNIIASRGRWGDPVEAARDVASDAALKIIERRCRLSSRDTVPGFLVRLITYTALDHIKKNYRHYRGRVHDSTGQDNEQATDALARIADHGTIPESAYDRLMSDLLEEISTFNDLDKAVAMQRIIQVKTVSGIDFANIWERSEAWASNNLDRVTQYVEAYVLAMEYGIGK